MIEPIKGHPCCEECQCYPECRSDCQDHLQCVERLPVYAERVFGSDRTKWPAAIQAEWSAKGWETLAEKYARYESRRQECEHDYEFVGSFWQFWKPDLKCRKCGKAHSA